VELHRKEDSKPASNNKTTHADTVPATTGADAPGPQALRHRDQPQRDPHQKPRWDDDEADAPTAPDAPIPPPSLVRALNKPLRHDSDDNENDEYATTAPDAPAPESLVAARQMSKSAACTIC
jgi:hypothetical protein